MQSMQEALHKIHSLQAGLLCTAWGSSGRPDKASLALMRGLAYAHAGKFEQALRVSWQYCHLYFTQQIVTLLCQVHSSCTVHTFCV